MEILFFWFLCGIVSALIGKQKGFGCNGFLLGVLLGPIGIIIVLLVKGNRKQCTFCKELINSDAIKCPKCRSKLAETVVKKVDFSYKYAVKKTNKLLWVIAICLLPTLIILSIVLIGSKSVDDRKPAFNYNDAQITLILQRHIY